MNSIRVRPNTIAIIGICLFLLFAYLFSFHLDFFLLNKQDASHEPNWYGSVFLLLAFYFLTQLKTITIADGKIVIRYILTRKKITAPMEMLSRVTFGNTKSETGSSLQRDFGDRIILFQFKDNRNTRVKINGGFHSNTDELELFIKRNYPGLNW